MTAKEKNPKIGPTKNSYNFLYNKKAMGACPWLLG
jgi:hypothetical protein